MIKGVLLDVDGTLVLSNDAHAQAWVEALGHFGHTAAFEDVRWLVGMGGDKVLPRLVPGLKNESGHGKRIKQYRTKLFLNKYVSKLEPTPGSRVLVEKLKASGLKLIIASSANKEELADLLRAAKVDDLLKEATTSSDADNSKPDPDIVHAALKKIGLPAHEVLMIGDTPYDIEAAGKAGVRLVAVRSGGWDDDGLEGAVAIYHHPANIMEHYETSPFASK